MSNQRKLRKVNKPKERILSDIQLSQDAERRRAIIRDLIFPFLEGMDENISYTKIFLQAFSGLIEGVYEEKRKITTLGDMNQSILRKLDEVFPHEDTLKEKNRYIDLAQKLEGISVQDLSYATELSRYIEGYLLKEESKKSIKTIDISKILG